jgi:hypothetical protein
MTLAPDIERLELWLKKHRFAVRRMPVANGCAIVGRRSEFRVRWLMTRLHVLVLVVATDRLTVEIADEIIAAATTEAVHGKPGLPRGLQTGTGVVPVVVANEVDDAVPEYIRTGNDRTFAVVCVPALVQPTASHVVVRGKPQLWGRIYYAHLAQLAEEVAREVLAPQRNVYGSE